MSVQYGELRLTSGWDHFVSLRHPANFNGFRVLAALLHGTVVVGVSQTLRRWTEGATYIRQGGHHVGHWPTFLGYFAVYTKRLLFVQRFEIVSTKFLKQFGRDCGTNTRYLRSSIPACLPVYFVAVYLIETLKGQSVHRCDKSRCRLPAVVASGSLEAD